MRAATLAARLRQCQVKNPTRLREELRHRSSAIARLGMAAASAAGGAPLHGTVAMAFLVQENLEHQFLGAAPAALYIK